MLSDFSRVNKYDLEKAAKFGTAVHTLVELYETDKLDRPTIAPILEALLQAWERCKKDNKIVVRRVEVAVVSLRYRFAGRLDVIAEVRGVPAQIELKSRDYNPVTEKLQTIAYQQAFNESYPKERVNRRYFCGLDYKKEDYDFREIKRVPGEPEHLAMFLSALAIYNWKGVSKR